MYKSIAGILAVLVSTQTLAQANSLAFVPVPALDDVALIALSVLVAVAAGFAMRNRRK